MVTAIGTILVVRFYLHLTGYPQVGGGTLHIAHMLWGGLLMAVSIGIQFSFLSRSATRLAVFVGGIGFGLFIDEVGKFVTKDNDYFFRPAVAIMYGTFVMFYLMGRLVHGRRAFTRTEFLANALNEMQELVVEDLDEKEKSRAQVCLSKSSPTHPLTQPLRKVLAAVKPLPLSRPGPVVRFNIWLRRTYQRVADLPGFAYLLIVFFAAQLVIRLAYLFGLIFLGDIDSHAIMDRRIIAHITSNLQTLTFADEAQIVVGAVAAVFVLLGILSVRRSRLRAYRFFRTSILINIFLTEIFVFAREEFGALIDFAFNLSVLGVLSYLIEREALREGSEAGDE